ncbi:MAG: hypothetical protein RDU20_09930 [Desulfomonilaceae bacterium]|nr:hypothetical protein [Desulfomonilaceae bacterium]
MVHAFPLRGVVAAYTRNIAELLPGAGTHVPLILFRKGILTKI